MKTEEFSDFSEFFGSPLGSDLEFPRDWDGTPLNPTENYDKRSELTELRLWRSSCFLDLLEFRLLYISEVVNSIHKRRILLITYKRTRLTRSIKIVGWTWQFRIEVMYLLTYRRTDGHIIWYKKTILYEENTPQTSSWLFLDINISSRQTF